jgi:hypothetical protein
MAQEGVIFLFTIPTGPNNAPSPLPLLSLNYNILATHLYNQTNSLPLHFNTQDGGST